MFANMSTTCYLFTGFQVYASSLLTVFILCMLDTCYLFSLLPIKLILPGLHLLSWSLVILSLPLSCLHHWFSVFSLFIILIIFHCFLQGETALTEMWAVCLSLPYKSKWLLNNKCSFESFKLYGIEL